MMTLAALRPLCVAPVLLLAAGSLWAQSPSVYYVCPGNVFTNAISAKEAEAKGCKVREATQPTTIAGPKPRPVAGPSGTAPKMDRIDSAEQRSRDSDARRILEEELKRAEEQLEAMRREYNSGDPERRGDESRNNQKYVERVAELKAAIMRQEADVAAIKREIAKLPT